MCQVKTRSFQNDMRNLRTKDDVLALLIHLGYLAYDSGKGEAFIPNKEIAGEFENAMSVGGRPEIMRILKASDKLLQDTLDGDGDSVARGLDRTHMEEASILTYNDENSLACAIGLAYYSARMDYKTHQGAALRPGLRRCSISAPAFCKQARDCGGTEI